MAGKTDTAKLFELVPEDGSSVGNTTLRRSLGWEPDKYFRVHHQLVEEGQLVLGRGRGGSVRRAQPGSSTPRVVSPSAGNRRERDLYPGFLTALNVWVQGKGWTRYHVEQVADQGRKRTGGTWTRPDFVVFGVAKYDFTPGIIRDVETFELKLADCDVQAVFEVASHSRAATKSYLAILRENGSPDDDALTRIESECQRFGLGLILFDREDELESWDYRVDPIRAEPDPALLDDFMKAQIKASAQLRKWIQ